MSPSISSGSLFGSLGSNHTALVLSLKAFRIFLGSSSMSSVVAFAGEGDLEDLPYRARLAREGHDGYPDVPVRRGGEEAQEDRAEVLGELGGGLLPPPASVHVDHRLVEVDREEVDADRGEVGGGRPAPPVELVAASGPPGPGSAGNFDPETRLLGRAKAKGEGRDPRISCIGGVTRNIKEGESGGSNEQPPAAGSGGQPAVTRRKPRRLNPAFASAHGINDSKNKGDKTRPGGPGRRPPPSRDTDGRKKKVDVAIRTARSSGKMNLSDCALSRLPDEIFSLRTNVTIDLSLSIDNPGFAYGEDEVTLLDISDNSLAGGIDERVSNLTSLQILRARRCDVAEVPWRSVVLKLDNLLTLDLAGNSLSVAMLELLPMTMREVDLSNNSLTRITGDDEPPVVLPSLIRLDLANNRLNKLPMRMEVPSLRHLIFAGNEIGEEFPDALIRECEKSLTTLDGQRNKLRRVPSLVGCKRLRVVDFGDNALIDVPQIGEDVIELNLVNNKLKSIGGLFAEMEQSPDFRSKLGELRLRGNKVESLDPAIVRCLASVTFIDASMNNLKDLPSVLGYLPCLRRMPLEGNAIRSIRASLLTNTPALMKFLRGRDSAPPGDDYLAGPDPAGSAGGALTKVEVEVGQAKSLVNSALAGTFTLDLSGKELSNMPGALMAELTADCANGGGTVGGRVR
ncbi:hypothetical protein THAOC_12089, partial [Thalassiosira oceanica]